MKNNYTKLGKVTEIIGYLITFGSMFLLLIAFFSSKRFFGITEIITLLITAVLIYFIGKSIFLFNKRYKQYQNDKIETLQFKKYWRKSLFATLFIVATSLLVLSKNLKSEKKVSHIKNAVESVGKKNDTNSYAKFEELRNSKTYRYSLNLILLLPFIILIPQLYFLYKTSQKQLANSNGIKMFSLNIKDKIGFVNQLNTKELFILSLVFGTVVALIIGYLFGENWHYNNKGIKLREVPFFSEDKGLGHNEFHFNYLLGVSSLIIVTGISYLFLKTKKK